jgi:hypothetical protein
MGLRDSRTRGEPGRPGVRPTGMTAPRRLAVSVAFAALALAGCGTVHDGAQQAGGPAGGTATTTATTTAAPPSSSTPAPTKPSGPKGAAVTVDGVITAGVEPGCYVLTPDRGGQKYLVIMSGSTGKPPVDVPVTVHGVTQPGTMSYCQQGTPLAVSTLELR